MAVFYLDLDNFKQVNDTYGHQKGDELLREIALRLKNSVRDSDVMLTQRSDFLISRLGGDEFALILVDIKFPSQAGAVADGIIKAVNKPVMLDNHHQVSVGVSIGIACFPYAGETAQDLQKAADVAMYKAKQNGKKIFTIIQKN